MKKVLIIGSGGREHALASSFAKSAEVGTVFVAPGNPGMVLHSEKIQCVAIPVLANEELVSFAIENEIDYTFVGPEVALEAGIVDVFRAHQLSIVGPTKAAAQIESSKIFAKNMMEKAGIPTAAFRAFQAEQVAEAQAYAETLPVPLVIKESGLAAGKGVYICSTHAEGHAVLADVMTDKQSAVVIEEFMEGPEFSHFSLIHDDHIISLGLARDYKRAYDGDKGLNTGGMGAITLLSEENKAVSDEIVSRIVRPLVAEMSKSDVPYTGILYTGVMQTKTGIRVIEFNARFGDPETQVLLPLIENDWMEILTSHFEKQPITMRFSKQQSLGVIVAANGYPQKCEEGFALNLPAETNQIQVYYSGVAKKNDQLVAAGGRIFMATTQAEDLQGCRERVYSWLDELELEQAFYRRDIGSRKNG